MEEQNKTALPQKSPDSNPDTGINKDTPTVETPVDSSPQSTPPESIITEPTPPQPPTTPPPPVSSPPPLASSTPRSSNKVPWLMVLILLFLGCLTAAAWYFHTQLQKTTVTAPTTSTSVSKTMPKVLIIGTDPTYPPMENIVNGQFVGFDIDLANLIAKQMGAKVEWKNITFDSLFTALDQGQINMAIAAITITPQRELKYEFSEPYLNDGQVIITQKINTDIKGPSDLKGKTIGVQVGTTNQAQALTYTSSNDVVTYPDFVHATAALLAGKVDAVMTDLTSAQGIVAANPTLKIAGDPFTNDYYGIVFRKGDPTVKQVNKVLDSLRQRGYLTELEQKWLQ